MCELQGVMLVNKFVPVITFSYIDIVIESIRDTTLNT